MKLLIASDIHGSAFWCESLLKTVSAEKPDKILLLGDILYHGPRNDLPQEYAPKRVIEMLNNIKDIILCVRGNCDTEVDQMVLNFPILADYAVVFWGNRPIYATHGHVYNEFKLPSLCKGDILLCGHTHVPTVEEHDLYTYINPGSVSIPKENSPHSLIIAENNVFKWKNIETGEAYKEYAI